MIRFHNNDCNIYPPSDTYISDNLIEIQIYFKTPVAVVNMGGTLSSAPHYSTCTYRGSTCEL